MSQRLFSFVGGGAGSWRVSDMKRVKGDPLPLVSRIAVVLHPAPEGGASWVLRGVTSNDRYATRDEKARLVARQAPLGRPQADRAALIPIRKTSEWWALPQDERRRIFEEQSNHIRIGEKYLPAIARRLHHCRDLGTDEPFDFLTWFEFGSSDAKPFEELLAELRRTEEWRYVEREVDIRLERAG